MDLAQDYIDSKYNGGNATQPAHDTRPIWPFEDLKPAKSAATDTGRPTKVRKIMITREGSIT